MAAALDAEAEALVGVGLGPAVGRAGGAWRLIAAPGCADADDEDDVAPLPLLLVGAPVPVAEPPRGFLRYGLTIAMIDQCREKMSSTSAATVARRRDPSLCMYAEVRQSSKCESARGRTAGPTQVNSNRARDDVPQKDTGRKNRADIEPNDVLGEGGW